MDPEKLAEQTKALADPTRLRILSLLPTEPVCRDVYNVSELAEELQIPQPTVSHHLRVLYQAGLIRHQRMCRGVYYWIDADAVRAMTGSILALVEKRSLSAPCPPSAR